MGMQDDVNNIEIIEFLLCNNHYGVSTDLINEIMAYQSVVPVPNAHPSVEGIFMPRDKMITAIDLADCLQIGTRKNSGYFVVTQVNNMEVAFHIDNVVGIHKIERGEIRDVGFSAQENGYLDGVVKINEKLIILLDFTNIVGDVIVEELAIEENDSMEETEFENE